ncbi:MAG: 3,4-dihydroxy-2-butanone-4-phosphate synthase [Myxococcales bacterium]|nr:3,4-dihydroxy-2-butanone-4-phosphate synthase [Myxococcales bacterium]
MTGLPEGSPIERAQAAIDAIRRGEMVILVDDEDRENEGDLVLAAEKVTPEAINFMAKYARGLICLSLTEKRLRKLGIPMMVQENTSQFGTAFTVSIEARTGVTTGISAADRARTVQVAVDPKTRPEDLVRPGHIFPLRARRGGVLVRTGQTEGSVDLARLAGLTPAGVICEIMNDDGTMARMGDLESFAETHDLLICSITDLIEYRLQRESLVEKLLEAPCPTEYGEDFRVFVFESLVDQSQHVALVKGQPTADKPTLVRVQHHIVTADVFQATTNDTKRNIIRHTLSMLGDTEAGVLIYMYPPEQTPLQSIQSHLLQEPTVWAKGNPDPEKAVNTVHPMARDIGLGCQILSALGVGQIKLITNNPRKIVGIESYGLEVVGYAKPGNNPP